jgi:tetratricopeptide (TPR) repeat protein
MKRSRFTAALLSPRTLALVFAGALAALGAAPERALAQEGGSQAGAVRREHPELSYARAVGYAYEWYDLAFEVLDTLERSRPPADVQEEALLLRLELQTAWVTAPSFKDDAKKKEVLEAVKKGYEDIARKKKGTDAAVQANLRIGEMLLQEGDGAVARMRQTDDAEVRAQARKEAEEKYTAGRKYFEDIREDFQKAAEKAEDEAAKAAGRASSSDDPVVQAAQNKVYAAHNRVLTSRFNAARALYNHALLFEPGSKDRTDRLTKCAGEFEEINFDYARDFLGCEAAIYLGLCAKELGNILQAATAFEAALGVKDFFEQDDQGHYALDVLGQDIVSRACYFKAQMLNETKDHDGALKAVKDLFELMPALAKSPLGFAARIEEGKAWGGRGDMKKAQGILDRVAEEAKGTPWAQGAKEALALLGQGGGAGLTVAPEKVIPGAKSSIDRGKVPEGLASLRNLIAQLEGASPEDQKKWLGIAWSELGKAYLELRRYDEAAAAFEALVGRAKDKELSPAALFQEAMAHLQANGARNNDFDKNNYLEALRKLQKDYPDDDAAKASSFFLGIERFSARDYVAAAKEFEKTTASAKKLYDAALYQAALCYVMEGRRLASDKEGKKDEAGAKAMFSQAQLALKKAIAWASEEAFEKGGVPKEGDRAATLAKMAFDGRCRLAEVYGHPLIRDAAKALAAAQEAERGLGAGADPDKVAQARYLAVQGFLLADQVDKAEGMVGTMGRDCPKAVLTAQAERDVAASFDRMAEEARKTSLETALPLYRKAADHLTRWFEIGSDKENDLDLGARDAGRDLSRAADKLYIYAKLLNGLDDVKVQSFVEVEDLTKLGDANRFLTAARAYKEVVQTPAGDWKVGIKLGQCHGFARDWDNAQKVLLSVCKAENLLVERKAKDEKGKDVTVTEVDVSVAGANTFLLFAYQDYANAAFQQYLLKREGARSLLDDVIGATSRIITVSPAGQEPWWRGKYLVLAALYEKGEYGDATIGLRQLKRQNPLFDKDKFGLREKFLALEQRLEGKAPPAKGGGGKK